MTPDAEPFASADQDVLEVAARRRFRYRSDHPAPVVLPASANPVPSQVADGGIFEIDAKAAPAFEADDRFEAVADELPSPYAGRTEADLRAELAELAKTSPKTVTVPEPGVDRGVLEDALAAAQRANPVPPGAADVGLPLRDEALADAAETADPVEPPPGADPPGQNGTDDGGSSA